MDLIRALRIARHHWLVITSIIAGTAAVAIATATYRNSTIEPLNRAEAPITFISDLAELDDPEGALLQVVQAQLEDARTRALQVNAEVLADPSNEVVVDPTLGRITFIARSPDAEDAVATATEMRRRLITRQPVNMETQIEEQLQSLSDQMADVRDQIEALDADNALPPGLAARRERLTTLLGQLETQALELERQILVPSNEEGAPTSDELSAELDEVNEAIDQVTAELEEIPSQPSEFSEQLTERRALERQFRELEANYQDLVLQRSELSGEPIAELVDVFDETPDAISRRMVAAVAVLLGGGLALAAVLVIERVRRPVWFAEDIPQVPFLGTVPARQVTPLPWYIHTGESPRKRAIQTLRSSIRARGGAEELVVGIAGSKVSDEAVQTFGADLALSFASTHISTALIATTSQDIDFPEFDGHSFSLNDIASFELSSDQMQERVEDALGEKRSAHSNMMTVRAGDAIGVAADVLAGPQVGSFFETLREMMDVVIVVSGDLDDPSTRAALDRTDLALVVTAPGRSPRAELVQVSDEMAVHQIDLVGVMLKLPVFPRLRARLSRARERIDRDRSTRGAPRSTGVSWVPGNVVAAIAGILPRRAAPHPKEPVPDRTASSEPGAVAEDPDHLGAETTLTLAEPTLAPVVQVRGPDARLDVPIAPEGEEDLHRTMQFLESHEPAEAHDSAESLLVRWTTQVVEAEEGTGLDALTVSEVRTAGFVPLSTWKGHPSLGSRLRHEFRRKLGKRDAARFEDLLLKAVGFGRDPGDITSMDRWVSRHYFELHAAAGDWEPSVWHVTSPEGTVSALIAAERLDVRRIEMFVDGVVIRAIERLARRQRRKERLGDGQAAELERQMEDARALGLALAWLMDGSHSDARLWYPGLSAEDQPDGWKPDWSRGLKHNIAPLQRLGILAAPVLTEEELDILDPTG